MYSSFLLLIAIIIFAIIIFTISKIFKRIKEQGDEKQKIQNKDTLTLKKHVDEINKRLIIIEKTLKKAE